MVMFLSIRLRFLLGFIATTALMGFAYYLESKGFIPCPLCLSQRVMMVALSIVCFIGMLRRYQKFGNISLSLLAMLINLAGMVLAGRQTWLQYAPPHVDGGCGVSLQYLLSTFPITEVAKIVWQGGVECSEVGSTMVGLSLAEWSLIVFGVFFIFSILQFQRSFKQ